MGDTNWGGVGQGAASGAATGTAIAPGLGTAIGAVVGGLAAFFGGKSAAEAAAKLTPEQRQLFDFLKSNIKTSSEFGNFMMKMSRDPIIGGMNWLQGMAHGDRETLARYANLDEVGRSAQRSIRTMSELAPRSSASAEFLNSMPQQVQAQGQQRVADLRKEGEQGLFSAGTNLASIGNSAMGAANGQAQDLLGFTQHQRQYAGQVGSDTAGSLYSIFQNVLGYNSPATGTRQPGAVDAISNWWSNRGSGRLPTSNPNYPTNILTPGASSWPKIGG